MLSHLALQEPRLSVQAAPPPPVRLQAHSLSLIDMVAINPVTKTATAGRFRKSKVLPSMPEQEDSHAVCRASQNRYTRASSRRGQLKAPCSVLRQDHLTNRDDCDSLALNRRLWQNKIRSDSCPIGLEQSNIDYTRCFESSKEDNTNAVGTGVSRRRPS